MNIQRTQPFALRDLTEIQGTAPSPKAPQAGEAPASTPARAPAEASLWELLTPEEQEFFRQQQAVGPITYRPNGEAGGRIPLPTGQRIDVRG
jgi:hypothetical protein